MNIDYLRNISDVNMELLPTIMTHEYNKIKFVFDIKRDGSFFPRKVFKKFYADINPEIDNNKIDKSVKFNSVITNSIEDYNDGFWDAYYEENTLVGITKEEDQIFEIFSRIYKKLDSILNPSILTFKKNIPHYNAPYFIKKHLYDYGFEVGTFIKAWTIILNNITLFEGIFTKYCCETTNNSSNPYPEIFTGNDNKAFCLFDDFAKEVTEAYLDFSFIFQKMIGKNENLIKAGYPHKRFMDWLFDKNYISESIYSEFKIKATFSTKADRGMRPTRYYIIKERYFPHVSD